MIYITTFSPIKTKNKFLSTSPSSSHVTASMTEKLAIAAITATSTSAAVTAAIIAVLTAALAAVATVTAILPYQQTNINTVE